LQNMFATRVSGEVSGDSPVSSPASSPSISIFATISTFFCYALSGETPARSDFFFYFIDEPVFATCSCCRMFILLPEVFFCYMQI
jgi:hypothetical protein